MRPKTQPRPSGMTAVCLKNNTDHDKNIFKQQNKASCELLWKVP